MNIDQEAYNELSYYTLSLRDPAFIHQHVVDAYAAQSSGEGDKPIRLTFALVGLYLHVEKQFTGRQVQLAHMKLGERKETWPVFTLPENRGEITVRQVLAATAGPERDEMIHLWCVSVWNAFSGNRETVSSLLKRHGII